MLVDIWFTRHDNRLYFAVAKTGEEPAAARRTKSVHSVYAVMKNGDYEIATVGIVPPDFLGLE